MKKSGTARYRISLYFLTWETFRNGLEFIPKHTRKNEYIKREKKLFVEIQNSF